MNYTYMSIEHDLPGGQSCFICVESSNGATENANMLILSLYNSNSQTVIAGQAVLSILKVCPDGSLSRE